jgi:hypothetical protein
MKRKLIKKSKSYIISILIMQVCFVPIISCNLINDEINETNDIFPYDSNEDGKKVKSIEYESPKDNSKSDYWGLLTKIWPILKFNSYIDLSYNSSLLADPLPRCHSTVVPLTISYKTDIPENFLRFLPWMFRNIILFFKIISPLQEIEINILNNPEWADMYVSTPILLLNIPQGSEVEKVETSLVIFPNENAPCKPYELELSMTCDKIGRLSGYERQESIFFITEYYPCLNINSSQFTECPRNQSTTIPINVTNCGNSLTRVSVYIVDCPAEFFPIIIPSCMNLNISETGQFYLEIFPPSDFVGNKFITLNFIAEIFPPRPDYPIGNYTYYLAIKVV